MKRGTTPTLPVRIKLKESDITSIEFLFKQVKSETAPETLKKIYPSEDVSYNTEYKIFEIEF